LASLLPCSNRQFSEGLSHSLLVFVIALIYRNYFIIVCPEMQCQIHKNSKKTKTENVERY